MEATRKSNHSETSPAIGPLVERAAAGAHDAVDFAADAAGAAAKAVDKKGAQLVKLHGRYMESARERVRENPLTALGIAAAAGAVVSLLIGRR